MAASPAENDPVSSLSHPMTYGPTNPPVVPMELMKARPPAAAMPVRKRGGIVQKIARDPRVQSASHKAQDAVASQAAHAAEVAKDKVTDVASTAADKVRRDASIQPAP